MAYIQGDTTAGQGFACSGTVISSNLILTAGHCAFDLTTSTADPASGYLVATGASDWATATQISTVSQTFLAPGYDPATSESDAAILQLATPTSAPALALATASQSSFVEAGDGLAMAGWGLTDASDPDSAPTELQWAPTVVQAPSYCATAAAGMSLSFDAATALCSIDAPYDDDAFCHGDSGGPLVGDYLNGEPYDPTEVGIISRGTCSTSSPGLSTRVDAISAWAQSLIAATAPAPAPAPAPTPAPTPTPPTTPTTPTTSPAGPVSLGTLSSNDARADVREVLAGVFHRRFTGRTNFREDCRRNSKTMISCGMTWTQGPTDYYGAVTIYLTRQKNQVVWSDHYDLKSVNNYCYFDSGHRSRCRVTRHNGIF
jgi:secreted trypsin-like serine protease